MSAQDFSSKSNRSRNFFSLLQYYFFQCLIFKRQHIKITKDLPTKSKISQFHEIKSDQWIIQQKKCFSSKAKAQCLTKNNEANLAKEGKKLALKNHAKNSNPPHFYSIIILKNNHPPRASIACAYFV